MKNLAIIPARGGSKRIPRKNIRNFLGKPIISYSIEAALKSEIFDDVMVSTEDEEIASISKSLGATVPFLRSNETASDFATTAEVILEVIEEYKKRGEKFDNVCCIYATAPFVTVEKIKLGMEPLLEKKANFVFPVVRFSYPPQRALVIRNMKAKLMYPEFENSRSQDLELLYHDCGQFYCISCFEFVENKGMLSKDAIPLIYPESEVQDIDVEEDWRIAEMKYMLMQEKYNEMCR